MSSVTLRRFFIVRPCPQATAISDARRSFGTTRVLNGISPFALFIKKMHTNPETKAKLQQFSNTQDQVKAVAKWWRSLNQEGKWLMQHEAKKFKSFPRTFSKKVKDSRAGKKRVGPYQKFIQAYMKKKENAFLPPVLRFKRATEAYRLAKGGTNKKIAAAKSPAAPAGKKKVATGKATATSVGKKKVAKAVQKKKVAATGKKVVKGKKAVQPKKAVVKTARKAKQ